MWREDLIADCWTGTRPHPVCLRHRLEPGALLRRFDAVVLLSAPADVFLQRIEHGRRTTTASSGERELILRHLAEVEPLLRATCTHEIDATQPIGDVVAQLEDIGRIRRTSLRRSARPSGTGRRSDGATTSTPRSRPISEALGVILERLPFDEQEIAARALDTAQQPERDEKPGLAEMIALAVPNAASNSASRPG